jgi:FMN phosphatase YigB (HAD superfamily)
MSAEQAIQDIRLQAVQAAIEGTRPDLLTFDIFDTLVFRRTDKPFDAFALIGLGLHADGRLLGAMSPSMFGVVRRDAEAVARERREELDGSHETDLHGVYECFPRWPLRGDVTVDDLVANEIAVERSLLVPDLDVVSFLEGVKETGLRVAAVSDIYFREPMLRELLQLPRLGPLLRDVEIFASADLGFGKGSGLWDRTEEVLGVPATRIVHFGDNPIDDVKKAKKAGVTACYFPQRDDALSDVVTRERLLRGSIARPGPAEARHRDDPSGLQAVRGKVVEGREVPLAHEPYWRYGASVLGPVLSGFAQWVAREAAAAGVSRLACLMREGTLLAELIGDAGPLEGTVLVPVPTWLNRHVGLASTLEASEDGLDRLLHGRSGLTLVEALSLLGLGLTDVPALAGQAHTRLFDPTVRRALVEAVEGDKGLRAKAAAHARELSGRVADVLAASADASGALWLVDLGWGATIQADACEILRANGSDLTVVGHYLATNAGAARRVAEGLDVRSFLLDAGTNEALAALVLRSPEIIEQVTCDAVGTQLGLDADLRPITAQLDPATAGQRRQAEVVRQGVRDFHRAWLRYRGVVPDLLPSLAGAQAELLPILVRSVVSPTVEEAACLGGWRHDEGRGSNREDPLVGQDPELLITHGPLDELQRLPMQELYWPAGLVAQHKPEFAPLAQAAASGVVPWSALSSFVGHAVIELVDAAGGAELEPYVRELRTTANGNVLLQWQGEGSDLQSLALQLCKDPHVVRLDALEVKLWEQGSEEPRVVHLANPGLALQVPIDRYITAGHNVFAARAPGATIALDLHELRREVVYRIEVIAAYGLLITPGPLGGHIPFESERVERLSAVLDDMRGSTSWKLTRPLRGAQRAAKKLGSA